MENNRETQAALKCPICGFRIADANINMRFEVTDTKRITEAEIPDITVKCIKCKHLVGIRKMKN